MITLPRFHNKRRSEHWYGYHWLSTRPCLVVVSMIYENYINFSFIWVNTLYTYTLGKCVCITFAYYYCETKQESLPLIKKLGRKKATLAFSMKQVYICCLV
jgi:hypothetical protein